MSSIFTLEGPPKPRLWTATEFPRQLGDTAVMNWMRTLPAPVAIGASLAMSIGVGFLISLGALTLLGKRGPASSKAVAGTSRRRQSTTGIQRMIDARREEMRSLTDRIGDTYSNRVVKRVERAVTKLDKEIAVLEQRLAARKAASGLKGTRGGGNRRERYQIWEDDNRLTVEDMKKPQWEGEARTADDAIAQAKLRGRHFLLFEKRKGQLYKVGTNAQGEITDESPVDAEDVLVEANVPAWKGPRKLRDVRGTR